MENTPFLWLDEEIALVSGPNSHDETEHDTHKKLLGQFEITVILNKQVVCSLKCTVPQCSTHLLIPEDCCSFKSTSNTLSFSGIRKFKKKILSWRKRCPITLLLQPNYRIKYSCSFRMWHVLFLYQKGNKEGMILK